MLSGIFLEASGIWSLDGSEGCGIMGFDGRCLLVVVVKLECLPFHAALVDSTLYSSA